MPPAATGIGLIERSICSRPVCTCPRPSAPSPAVSDNVTSLANPITTPFVLRAPQAEQFAAVDPIVRSSTKYCTKYRQRATHSHDIPSHGRVRRTGGLCARPCFLRSRSVRGCTRSDSAVGSQPVFPSDEKSEDRSRSCKSSDRRAPAARHSTSSRPPERRRTPPFRLPLRSLCPLKVDDERGLMNSSLRCACRP